MKLGDLWRLGVANIAAHKGRVAKVVIIVGLLFGVITAAFLLLQGGENIVFGAMNRATKGQVLLSTDIDTYVCEQNNCNITAEAAQVKENIVKSGGKLIDLEVYDLGLKEIPEAPGSIPYQNTNLAYALPAELLDVEFSTLEEVAKDTIPVLLPFKAAAEWMNIAIPEVSYGPSRVSPEKMQEYINLVQKVRSEALDKTVEKAGKKFYIAGILPTEAIPVGLDSVELNILTQLVLLSVPSVDQPILIAKTEQTVLDGLEKVDEQSKIWSIFPSAAKAYDYAELPANKCEMYKLDTKSCSREYRYTVNDTTDSYWGDEVVRTYDNYVAMWQVFSVGGIILAAIAVIVMLSTYTRVLAQDTKVISLYHAMGATRGQIRAIYLVYLLCISGLACVFALLLGVGLVAIQSFIQMTPIMQLLVLKTSAPVEMVWLMGWNWRILALLVLPLIVAPVCILINNRQFSFSRVARKLK